ncbi:hypothetical protein D3C84_981730 [compost metagenome]
MRTISIPIFSVPPARVTYYTLALEAERCPTFDLFYAHEHYEICLSPSLRPCDFRNGTQIMLLDHAQAAELASFAEPIMQRRYGQQTVVNVNECSGPESWARKAPFAKHAEKACALIEKFRAKGAQRSLKEKGLPKAEVVQLIRS